MNDMKILETVERYIRGEMNPDERLQFENLRKTNPDIDQLVVVATQGISALLPTLALAFWLTPSILLTYLVESD